MTTLASAVPIWPPRASRWPEHRLEQHLAVEAGSPEPRLVTLFEVFVAGRCPELFERAFHRDVVIAKTDEEARAWLHTALELLSQEH